MMPSIFRASLFDDFMRNPFDSTYLLKRGLDVSQNGGNLLKTDVKEADGNYEFEIDLPGYKKEEVTAKLEDGYLTIEASRNVDKDEKDNDGNYIRRERFFGKAKRSFYVGRNVKQEDINAKFEHGILRLVVPKEAQLKEEVNKFISIEG